MAQEKKEPSRREFIKTLAGLGLGAAMAQTLYSSLNPKQRAQLVAWAQSYGKPMTYAELGRLIDAAAWDDVVRAVRYQPASYIVYQAPDGSYQAKNGNTGQIEFSGTDAASVIGQVFNALTLGREFKERVVLKGRFVFNAPVNLVSFLQLDLRNAFIKLADGVNNDVFKATSATDVDIVGGVIDGNKANNPTGQMGLRISGASDKVRVFGTEFKNCKHSGVRVENVTGMVEFRDIISHDHDVGDGINVVGAVRRLSIFGGYYYSNLYTSAAGIYVENDGANLAFNIKIVSPRCWNNFYGLLFSNVYRSQIIGGHIWENRRHGVVISSSQGCKILGVHAIDNGQEAANTYSGIQLLDSIKNVVEGCTSMSPSSIQRFGIQEAGTSDFNQIIGNNVYDNVTANIVKVGANTVVKQNLGYPTERSGIATLAAGSTSVVVNHGLAAAPNSIKITPQANVGAPWASNITATSFTINVATAPAAAVNFYWEAEV